MPIDYSKFDSIDDSDEEKATSNFFAPPARTASAATDARSLVPSKSSVPEKKSGRNGRELLEGNELESRLTLISSPDSGSNSSNSAPGSSDPHMSALASALGLTGQGLGLGMAPGASEEPPKPGEPKRLCVKADGRKKIHTTYPDGGEVVEEYDEKTDVLMLRKSRKPTTLGGEAPWVFEVGQAPEAAFDPQSDLMRASQSNPIFLRKDTPEHFQWRIRNLPYPADVYSVSVDHDKQEVVVRTSNKKYFKRIQIPDLARAEIKLKEQLLSWKYMHNTLIISYTKPAEIIQLEQKTLREAEKSAMKL